MVLADSHRISPVPCYSGTLLGHSSYTYRAFTFCGVAFQATSISTSGPVMQALQPRCRRNDTGLGCSPFARHYLGNHYCFLFLWVLRCFSSPGVLYIPMYSVYSDWSSTSRVSPFGNPRIKTCLQFPVAYRSLSRPSSPVHAKASSIRHKLLKSSHFTWFGLVPFSTLLCLDTLFTTGVLLIWHRNAFTEKHLTTDTHPI